MRVRGNQLMELDYINSFGNSLKKLGEGEEYGKDKEAVKRTIFSFIKIYSKFGDEFNGKTREELSDIFASFSVVDRLIEQLTIKEFMEIFPPEKYYKGRKYEMIDYYSTMEHIEESGGIDTLIADVGAREFISNYYNRDIFDYNVSSMLLISAIQKADGKPSLADEFFADLEREKTIYKNKKGMEYKRNKDGSFARIGKKHLRIIK